MEIVQKKGATDGAFLIKDDDGNVIAEMTYVWSGDNHFIINHTMVNSQYRGHGLGKKMLEEAVEFARENNCTISPLCSFTRVLFDRNREYDDVRNSGK